MTCMMTLCELCMMAISCESIQFSRGNSSRLCCVSSLRLQVKSSFTTTFKRQINSIQSESHWCLSALVVPLLQVSTTRWPKGPTIPIRRLVLANTKAWYSSQTVILNTLTTIFYSVMVNSLNSLTWMASRPIGALTTKRWIVDVSTVSTSIWIVPNFLPGI